MGIESESRIRQIEDRVRKTQFMVALVTVPFVIVAGTSGSIPWMIGSMGIILASEGIGNFWLIRKQYE